mmetsp:Transcript_37175/g.73027  ORF Transcript_37175/g.73027 Transcript_37175/m.73027 type:complete len:450 (+) Transcript_37175:53-1402(+)|eukprot:CAMPEP_0175136830 /NCGR_PEP_ID=MMETSP0087-20121206/9488_1 /TAXON_ID=136419 /ORGANISM="Unknown Unknown, Strain D1" /LENGTH=449 /DNA_ID=CAMNT_0016419619 /DNA_START=52 /DNA_END=1401 /DNA_ORIENTATION=+
MEETKFIALQEKLWKFMREDIYPNEAEFHRQCEASRDPKNEWTHPPILTQLKKKAKSLGLWNLFLPVDSAKIAGHSGGGLTNLQYADICEIMGTACPAEFAAQATNCTSPDTGNMEVLARFGTHEQKQRWLVPLLEGNIRSAFAMTEPAVASSDATNIGIEIKREKDEYVINGQKWWTTGAGSLHCEILILMGKTNPQAKLHLQQSQILVPMNTPGITIMRPLLAMGHDDAPKGHMQLRFDNVRVPVSNVLLGEGRGFEISQARLGPGRIHHCMRAIGQAERALSLHCKRVEQRKAFGRQLAKFDNVRQDIAVSRNDIDMGRLLIKTAADLMDKRGNGDPYTRKLLSLVKAHIPKMVQTVADRAIQAHGAMGVCQDTPLFMIFAGARMLRIADGPDEVHWRTAGRIELSMQKKSPLRHLGYYPLEPEVFRVTSNPISEDAKKRVAAAKL